MKVRSDFVSNSSSCSFIIDTKYVYKACKVAYDKLHGLEVPYDIDNDITVRLYAKNKNVDMLFKKLDGYVNNNDTPYHYKDEDPEDINFDSIELPIASFIAIAEAFDADATIVSLIEQIQLESDDWGSGPMNLRDFYDFFDKNECKPNAEDSEHEFICEDNEDFRAVLKGKTR